ncbi:MAG TPA: hypothetical protein VFQ67_16125 [Allosphingosinicella sp.]|nr:hypothetical protein [Allosphingosinicella sp.]
MEQDRNESPRTEPDAIRGGARDRDEAPPPGGPEAGTPALEPAGPEPGPAEPQPEPAITHLVPLPAPDPVPPVAGFDPVPVRPRVDGWTPERQRGFIEHLAETLCVDTAAALVGMTGDSARRLRRRPGAEGFGVAWDAALRRGLSERGRAALIDEAVNGRLVRRFYHGELICEERVRSPRLLLALIERMDKLFEGPGAAESEAIAGDWHASLDRLESGALKTGFRVWRDREGAWWTNYPPPRGFQGPAGDPADPSFRRRLTEAEEKALAARGKRQLEDGAAARDAFFGFRPNRGVTYRRIRSKGGD